ncbi:MAG: hypothetical protein K0S37_4446 [Microbacterium sp.]|nr:hypothetical protein [Microbacterium sp.]
MEKSLDPSAGEDESRGSDLQARGSARAHAALTSREEGGAQQHHAAENGSSARIGAAGCGQHGLNRAGVRAWHRETGGDGGEEPARVDEPRADRVLGGDRCVWRGDRGGRGDEEVLHVRR